MAELPWEDPSVREENKMISLYLPEATKIKLKWLSEQTGVPQQKILRQAIVPMVDGEVEKILGKGKKRKK